MTLPGRTCRALVALHLTGILSADTFFQDEFNYPDGELAGNSNGNWTIPTVNSANPYAEVLDHALTIDWGASPTDPVANGYYTHIFSESRLSDGFVYARLEITPLAAPSGGSPENASVNFAAFWNNGTGFRCNLWYGLAVDAQGDEIADHIRLGLTDGQGSRSAIVWDDGAYPLNEPIQVIARYDLDNGVARLYLSPLDEEDFAVEVNDRSTLTIGGFGFRHKDDRPGISGGKLQVDRLVISDTFEVSGISDLPPSRLQVFGIPGNAIGLTWEDGSLTETGFLIDRKGEGDSGFNSIARVDTNITSFADNDVVAGKNYTYQIRAEGLQGLTPSDSSTGSAYHFPSPSLSIEPEMLWNPENEKPVIRPGNKRWVSYQSFISEDLLSWAITGPPLGEGVSSLPIDSPDESAFYRFTSSVIEITPNAGLTTSFESPRTGGGSILDAGSFGMAPSTTVNQATALQAALNVADAGDTIEVPAGDYYMTQAVRVPSGVILQGADSGATRFLVADGLEAFLFVPPGATDIEILNFTITAAVDSFENAVTVNDRYTSPLAERIRISGLTIDKFSSRAISVRNARHVLVENCSISRATALGGGGQGYGIELRDDHNHDNWVRNNTIGPVIRHAVLLQYRAHNNLVEGNTAIDTTEDAYDLHGEDEYLNELRGNLAYWRDPEAAASITAAGFGVGNTGSTHDDTGPGNWIHHNEVYHYTYGVDIILGSHHTYVDGNHLHDLRNAGVRIGNGGASFVYLRANRIEANAWGLSGDNADHLTAHHNWFLNNTSGGIRLASDSTDYLITGNDFTGQPNPLELGNDNGSATSNPGAD